MTTEPEKQVKLDAEFLAGHRFPYQEDIALVEDVDLVAATPGEDINWLEDVELLEEEGVPAVFDRYSNSFLKIYFPIPAGREDEIARKVLVKQSWVEGGKPKETRKSFKDEPTALRELDKALRASVT